MFLTLLLSMSLLACSLARTESRPSEPEVSPKKAEGVPPSQDEKAHAGVPQSGAIESWDRQKAAELLTKLNSAPNSEVDVEKLKAFVASMGEQKVGGEDIVLGRKILKLLPLEARIEAFEGAVAAVHRTRPEGHPFYIGGDFRYLLSPLKLPTIFDIQGYSLAFRACLRGDEFMAHYLLHKEHKIYEVLNQAGVRPGQNCYHGMAAGGKVFDVLPALAFVNDPYFNDLFVPGANIQDQSPAKLTPLHVAARENPQTIGKLFEKRPMHVAVKTADGRLALALLAERSDHAQADVRAAFHRAAAGLMDESNFDLRILEHRDPPTGNSLLHEAYRMCDRVSAEHLLSYSTHPSDDLRQTNNAGLTPLQALGTCTAEEKDQLQHLAATPPPSKREKLPLSEDVRKCLEEFHSFIASGNKGRYLGRTKLYEPPMAFRGDVSELFTPEWWQSDNMTRHGKSEILRKGEVLLNLQAISGVEVGEVELISCYSALQNAFRRREMEVQ